MRDRRVRREGAGRRLAAAAVVVALGVLIGLVPGAHGQALPGQVSIPPTPVTGTQQVPSGSVEPPSPGTAVDQVTGPVRTTVTNTSGTVVSAPNAAPAAPPATSGTVSGVPGSTAGAGSSTPVSRATVTGSPGTTIQVPGGSTQPLTPSTPLPPGTRFETIGRPPPPHGPNVMNPFPVVRIAGTLTRSGATIRVLSARAPGGSLAAARCRGRNCPTIEARSTVRACSARTSGRVRFWMLQRTYRAGVVLRVYVTAPGKWGKFTRFEIRKGLAPKRRDMCIRPGARRRGTPCAAIPRG